MANRAINEESLQALLYGFNHDKAIRSFEGAADFLSILTG
jgi:hypothetical protein